jgi:hypothetical protein
MIRRLHHVARAMRASLRALADEARLLVRSGFSLTATERETVVLICALFALGLAVRWLHEWLTR